MKKIAVILRGHIRKSFDTDKLLNLLTELVKLYDIDIYIHTWNKYEANSSWRSVDNSNQTIITSDDIIHYFDIIKNNIKKIIVDDDQNIELIGPTDGKISLMPKIAWKRMWYGINNITQSIPDSMNYNLLLTTRFDNCDTIQSINLGYGINIIKQMMDNFFLLDKNEIVFMKNSIDQGIDNFYMGPVKLIKQLHEKFNCDLETIISLNPTVVCQEYLVFYEGNKINKSEQNEQNEQNEQIKQIEKTDEKTDKKTDEKTNVILKKLLNKKTKNVILRLLK